MTYVVAEPCIKCKYTECVATCPVDCFHEGANMLVIDPEECIDCGACEPECPVSAIFTGDDLPEKWSAYAELNIKFSAKWPLIKDKHDPLPEAEEFKEVEKKRHLLVEAAP
jgi:ferredoxin